jgi:hypothetical protein
MLRAAALKNNCIFLRSLRPTAECIYLTRVLANTHPPFLLVSRNLCRDVLITSDVVSCCFRKPSSSKSSKGTAAAPPYASSAACRPAIDQLCPLTNSHVLVRTLARCHLALPSFEDARNWPSLVGIRTAQRPDLMISNLQVTLLNAAAPPASHVAHPPSLSTVTVCRRVFQSFQARPPPPCHLSRSPRPFALKQALLPCASSRSSPIPRPPAGILSTTLFGPVAKVPKSFTTSCHASSSPRNPLAPIIFRGRVRIASVLPGARDGIRAPTL